MAPASRPVVSNPKWGQSSDQDFSGTQHRALGLGPAKSSRVSPRSTDSTSRGRAGTFLETASRWLLLLSPLCSKITVVSEGPRIPSPSFYCHSLFACCTSEGLLFEATMNNTPAPHAEAPLLLCPLCLVVSAWAAVQGPWGSQ